MFIFGWVELFGINNGKFFSTIGDKSVNRRDIRLDYQWHISCSRAKLMNFKARNKARNNEPGLLLFWLKTAVRRVGRLVPRL